MSKVLIIGAGGVGQVVAHKCAQRRDIFSEITLASRTKSKCDAIAAQLKGAISTAQVDADNVPELVALIKKVQPKLVINVALPYQDLHIMDACLETGVDYLDTANYEPLETARFEYSWQWAYQDRFKQAGLMALLVSGGHTQLMRVSDVGVYELMGETVDDAAGEAFDKTAKLLGLPYPGDPALSGLAQKGDAQDHR